MTNLTDLTVDSLTVNSKDFPPFTTVELTGANETPTLKHGVIVLNRGGAITVTLGNPTATTDDYKRLIFVSVTTQAHVVNCNHFGNGGDTEDVATFLNVKGSCLALMAYQGYWYVTGKQGITIA